MYFLLYFVWMWKLSSFSDSKRTALQKLRNIMSNLRLSFTSLAIDIKVKIYYMYRHCPLFIVAVPTGLDYNDSPLFLMIWWMYYPLKIILQKYQRLPFILVNSKLSSISFLEIEDNWFYLWFFKKFLVFILFVIS